MHCSYQWPMAVVFMSRAVMNVLDMPRYARSIARIANAS